MSEQNPKSPNSRRDFLKTGTVGVLSAYVATHLISRNQASAQAGKKAEPVNPKDSMAQTLGYVEDAKKADTKKFPKRAAPGGEKQFCYNCQFYGEKTNPKASAGAPCTIFAGKVVKSHGWCNSWTQNPAVKD